MPTPSGMQFTKVTTRECYNIHVKHSLVVSEYLLLYAVVYTYKYCVCVVNNGQIYLQLETDVLFLLADEVEHGDGYLHPTAVDAIDQ